MAALTEQQRDVIARLKAATVSLDYAVNLAAEAMAEIQIAAAELQLHQAAEFELIAFDAIARARAHGS